MARAFSLLELLVSLSILGLILMISIPSIRSSPLRELRENALAVEGILERFRNLSILDGATYRIQIQPGEARVHESTGELLATFPLRAVHAVSGIPRAGVSLYGLGVVSPATLVLTNQSCSCSLTLSLRGRIRVECKRGLR
jgi:prepilin-type N-terminal cleavage/methylation domain-containing protein